MHEVVTYEEEDSAAAAAHRASLDKRASLDLAGRPVALNKGPSDGGITKLAAGKGGEEEDDGAAGGGCFGRKKKAAAKEETYNVPFSRLLALNKPEWPHAVVGMIASAGLGVIQVRCSGSATIMRDC